MIQAKPKIKASTTASPNTTEEILPTPLEAVMLCASGTANFGAATACEHAIRDRTATPACARRDLWPNLLMSLQLADALGRTDDIGQTDAELVVDDDDFAVRDERAIHEDIEWLARRAVKFHDRTLVQLQ